MAFSLKQRKRQKHRQDPKWNSFADVAEQMAKLPWKDITWGPLDQYGKPLHNFAFQGCLINGLLYTMAFAESGGGNWVDYVKGIGSVVGGLVDLVPGVGPILSMAVTFGLSLFGDDTESILSKLYDQIMQQVQEIVRAQEVQDATNAAKGQLSGFMDMLSNMAQDFLVSPGSSEVEKHKQWYSVLEGYIRTMDAEEYNIFGNGADCIKPLSVPMQPVPFESASQVCQDFWATGAIVYQFQYVLIHLNIMAQMAVFATFENETKAALSALRGKAGTYASLLKASYLGFLHGIPPAANCKYEWYYNATGIAGARLENSMWEGENVSCITGCVTEVPFYIPFPSYVGPPMNWNSMLPQFCTVPESKDTSNTCTQSTFDWVMWLKSNSIENTFEPMLTRLQSLADSSYSDLSQEMADWILSNPSGPKLTSSQVGFCEDLCEDVVGHALGINDDYGSTIKDAVGCSKACPKAFDAILANPTLCQCTVKLCPELRDTLSMNLFWARISKHQQEEDAAFDAWSSMLLSNNYFMMRCAYWCNQQQFPMGTPETV